MQGPLQQGWIDRGPTGPVLARDGKPLGPGLRQGRQDPQQLPQGGLIIWSDGNPLMGTAGPGQQPATQAFMQLQQAGGSGGKAAAQLLPVLRFNHHLQGLPQQRLQQLPLRDHKLAVRQLTAAPGRHQGVVLQQPERCRLRCRRALPAGEVQANGLEPGQLHRQQTLAQSRADHQRHGAVVESQGHQQAQQPAGITAGGQTHQGLIRAPQAAGHQPAQGEVVGPAGFPLQAEERLELLVGLGFQHRGIVGSWDETTVQR